jgi:hypothetical protein
LFEIPGKTLKINRKSQENLKFSVGKINQFKQKKTLPAIFFFSQIKLKNINYPLSKKEKTGNNKIKIKIKKLG